MNKLHEKLNNILRQTLENTAVWIYLLLTEVAKNQRGLL